MPFLLIAFAVIGVILLLQKDTNALNQDPNALPSTEKVSQDVLDSFTAQTQGITLTPLQVEQVKKFASIASIAGSAVTAGVAGVSSLTLATAGPIGAVVAAAIIAFALLRGTAHLVANQWTQNVQGKFGTALSAIVNEKDRSLSAGSATKQSLYYARLAISNLWNQYNTLASQFRGVDKDHETVIRQSYETLNPLMKQIFSDIDRQYASLKV